MPGEHDNEITKIGDLASLRALADPLRMRILRLFGDAPRSVRELATELDLPRNKLHYHVNVLERHGLIRVAETRTVDRGAERCYEPTGRTFEVRHLPMPPSVAAGLAGLLESAAQRVDARLRANAAGRTSVGQSQLRLTEAQHEELVMRMRALIDEYAAEGWRENAGPDNEAAADEDSATTTFVFALYEDEL